MGRRIRRIEDSSKSILEAARIFSLRLFLLDSLKGCGAETMTAALFVLGLLNENGDCAVGSRKEAFLLIS